MIITVHLFIINNKKIEFFFKGGQIQATPPAYFICLLHELGYPYPNSINQ